MYKVVITEFNFEKEALCIVCGAQAKHSPTAVPVKHVDLPHHHVPRTSWQMLGQLKLRPGSNPDERIKGWLMNVVGDLSLPNDLVSRLLASMEEATERVLSSDSVKTQLEYLEIAVLAPAGKISQGHTWGFFRVERSLTDPLNARAKGYCIEYYLYLDKKTGE